jgi:hypothetical protein
MHTMNSRSKVAYALAPLFIAAAFAGCISEHRYDDDVEWGEWDEETNTCVCDPNNSNNPQNNTPPVCPAADSAIYLSKDAAVCATIDFTCPEEHESFDNSCGCGCMESQRPTCPEENDATATYLSKDTAVCMLLNISCPEGRDPFNSGCGCGCVDSATVEPPPPPPPVCPDPQDPNVLYVNSDPAVCATIGFECPERCARFDSECGCGCLEN